MCKNLIKTKIVGQFIDERMDCLNTSNSVEEEIKQNTSFVRELVPFIYYCVYNLITLMPFLIPSHHRSGF